MILNAASQTTEFNRPISLMNSCNVYLPLYITMVELRAQQLELRFKWVVFGHVAGLQTWQLAQLVQVAKRAKGAAAVRDSFPEAELPWEPDESKRSWLTVSDGMETTSDCC